jgi:hypothetical protein
MVMGSPVLCLAMRFVLAPPRQRPGAVPGLNRARFDPTPELGGTLRTVGGILVQASEHDRFEFDRDRNAFRRERLRLLTFQKRATLV